MTVFQKLNKESVNLNYKNPIVLLLCIDRIQYLVMSQKLSLSWVFMETFCIVIELLRMIVTNLIV